MSIPVSIMRYSIGLPECHSDGILSIGENPQHEISNEALLHHVADDNATQVTCYRLPTDSVLIMPSRILTQRLSLRIVYGIFAGFDRKS